MKGDKNKYTCRVCGHTIFTLDVEDGVTPFMLACRSPTQCKGWMHSGYYRIDQTLVPDMSWYEWTDAKPDAPMTLRPILSK